MWIATTFVLTWFALAFGLSLGGWFERFSAAALFGIGAIVSATGFTVLHCVSERFRGFARACSLRRLTRGQALRFYGALALVKADQQILPDAFAIPTGLIDLAVAITSFLVASRLVSPEGRPRRGFFAFHVVGLVGLAVSVTLALLTSSSRFGLIREGVSIQAMAQFPMSLVPTFIGPLVLVFHLLAITIALQAYPKTKRRAVMSQTATTLISWLSAYQKK